MALITLGTLRDYWKKVSDWVDGTDAVSAPKVTVSGSLPAFAATPNVNVTGSLPAFAAIPAVKIDQTTPGTTNAVAVVSDKGRISSAPVTGVKTITSTAAELFAGASRKAERSILRARNTSTTIRGRVGPLSVTDTTGFGVEPEAVYTIEFDPAADVPMYAISEAGNITWEVFEA